MSITRVRWTHLFVAWKLTVVSSKSFLGSRPLCFQASDFATLAKASKAVPIMDEEPPEGCAVHIIDDQSQVRVVSGARLCIVCMCAERMLGVIFSLACWESVENISQACVRCGSLKVDPVCS